MDFSPSVTFGDSSLIRGSLFHHFVCGTVKTVPYGEVKTSSEEEVAFPKEMTEEGFQKPSEKLF